MNVYDFDNTIYDGESAFDFFLEYIKVNPSLLKMLPKVIHAMAEYKMGRVSVEQFMREYAPLVKKYYCEYSDWDTFTRRFWDSHMHKIKSFYSVIRRDDDVIVTASPETTIAEIASRLGVKNYVCSQIDNETGNVTRLCMREKKEVYFRESFPEAKIDDFYTDSLENDSFFALNAERVFLVKGMKIKEVDKSSLLI